MDGGASATPSFEGVDRPMGPRGGFALARPPSEISILDVVNAVDPFRSLGPAPQGEAGSGVDLLHHRLNRTMRDIRTMLGGATLADVLDEDTWRDGQAPGDPQGAESAA